MKGLEEAVLMVEVVEAVDSVESVEDCLDLRRKGTEGRRYLGKIGLELGSLGLRNRAMFALESREEQECGGCG